MFHERPVVLVPEHDRVGDVGVDAVARPARPGVRAHEARLRRGQVGVGVGDAVDVPGVEALERADQAPGEPAVDGEVAAPDLRELEVRLGERELVARGRRARDVRRLVGVDVRVERPRLGVVLLLEAGEDAGVADLVRDPDVGRTAREDAGAAAQLGLASAVQVPVEADAGRPEDVASGSLAVWYWTGLPSASRNVSASASAFWKPVSSNFGTSSRRP